MPTPHGVFNPIDEFDKVTTQHAAALVYRVFQLTFAALCNEFYIEQVRGVASLFV